MALPLIFFPSAITNSLSVLLLPIVSEAESNNNTKTIQKATRKTIKYCLLLGFACTLGFLLIGRSAGTYLFKSDLAGTFIISLSFICPFLYLTSTLSSVLHGLGKTFQTFIYCTISICIRLFFIFFLVPIYGIR